MKNKSSNNSSKNSFFKSSRKFDNRSLSRSTKSSKLSNTRNNFKDSQDKKNSKFFKIDSQNSNKSNHERDLFSKRQAINKSCEDLIWGKHSVYSALETNKPINRIWCTPEIRSSEKFFQILKEYKNKGVLLEEVPWTRISQITFGAVHQGIALQVAYSQAIPLKELIRLSKIKYSFPLIICLDGITDPHNVGAIIRSSEAFGCAGIVLPQRRSAGITGTVAKVAAGALEHLLISRVINLNRSLQDLKNEGFTVIGLTERGNINVSDFKEKVPLVIVVGSENKGLSVLTQRNCDYLIKIPLKGRTSSLNASVAAAISLHQISRNFL